ncbi:MAG: ABC transporter ATP-binding protein [Egibacteraceae bacterium]
MEKSYCGQVIIHPVDLAVVASEIVGVCGPSGSGKSTLLRLIGAVEAPDAGTVHFAGQPAWQRHRRQVSRPGYVMPVFQHPAASLDARWPIWRSLSEPLLALSCRPRAADRRACAIEALASVGLDGLDPESRPGELSIGQCQRIAILRALMARPALIIADEPTSALDLTTAKEIRDLLRVTADQGTSIVVVSHDVAMLASISDRLLRLNDGHLGPLPATLRPDE